ncbi:MAG: hypothetical protein OEO19_05725 [Gammaproteobacteria bacterium]|nr:hypothetical protein [Gammaproteobacteria bacterium]
MPDVDFESVPCQGFSASDYEVRACPQARAIRHGDVIDLGAGAFEVMHLPGHSSGSIGFYIPRNQQFFSADVVYDGALLDELEDSVIDDYIGSMEQPAIENRRGNAGPLSQFRPAPFAATGIRLYRQTKNPRFAPATGSSLERGAPKSRAFKCARSLKYQD